MGQVIPTIKQDTPVVKVDGVPVKKHEKIATSAFGNIWRCTLPSGQDCALKEVNLKIRKTERMHQKEVNILVPLLLPRKK